LTSLDAPNSLSPSRERIGDRAEIVREALELDYQNPTMEQTLKLCEALAFGLPLAMAQAFEMMFDFSAGQFQLWRRAFQAPADRLLNVMWPQGASAAEVESLAMDLEQIRAELRSAASERGEFEGAMAARFDRVRDEIAALREELKGALTEKIDRAEIEHLHAEVGTVREELRNALAQREAAAPAASAHAITDLQTELRALRDRMGSGLSTEQTRSAGSSRPADEDPSRKRKHR
jgi:hypothetical protein